MLPFMLIIALLMAMLPMSCHGRLLDTSVACDQHNFILSLNFDVPFRGLVYSEDGFPNCIYVNGTMLSHLNYQLKIPLHGCETHINADGNFENGIIIQDNVAFLQSTDKKYLLTCIPSTPQTPTATTAQTTSEERSQQHQTQADETAPPFTASSYTTTPFMGTSFPIDIVPHQTETTMAPPPPEFGHENAVTVDFGGVQLDQSSTETIRGTLSPVPAENAAAAGVPELHYSVEIRAGHNLEAVPVNSALNIGDAISYVVRIRKPVSESQIGRCWASDSKSSLELSDEHGCSLQPRGNVWSEFERVENADEMVFVNRIKAWAFPTSNEVNIYCNLRVCMSRHCSFVTNCSEVTRQANEQQQRRRRRGSQQQTAGFEEIKTMETQIRVRPRRHTTAQKQQQEKQNQTEISSLRTNAPSAPELLEEEPDGGQFSILRSSWCLSLGQFLLVGACCSLASATITIATCYMLFSHFNASNQKSLTSLASSFTDGKNARDRDVWAMVEELKRQQQQRETRDGSSTRTRHAV